MALAYCHSASQPSAHLALGRAHVGLDLATSAAILLLLKELAAAGTTIIAAIHQLSAAMIARFNNLTLLARGGHVLFNGPVTRLAPYLADAGYALELFSVRLDEDRDASQARGAYLIQQWESNAPICADADFAGLHVDIAAFQAPRALPPLVCGFVPGLRHPLHQVVHHVPSRGHVHGVLRAAQKQRFRHQRPPWVGTEHCNLYFLGLLNNRALFHEEYKNGAYGLRLFSAAYTAVAIPFEVGPAVFLSALVVLVVELPRTPEIFFTVLYVSFACATAASLWASSSIASSRTSA